MRALNHLRKRFESSIRFKKPMYINQNDVDSLNDLIEIINGKSKNEHLEDALMLFYINQFWKVENVEDNLLKMVHDAEFLTPAEILLKKLSHLIRPKKMMFNEIFMELRLRQVLNKVPKEKRVKLEDVETLLNEVLIKAKSDFPIIKDLDKTEVRYVYN